MEGKRRQDDQITLVPLEVGSKQVPQRMPTEAECVEHACNLGTWKVDRFRSSRPRLSTVSSRPAGAT